MTSIVDTNVVLVSNGQHSDVSPDCIAICAQRLQAIMDRERIALDDCFEILNEYQTKTRPKHPKGPGDVFVKWALRMTANQNKCDLVPIQKHPGRGYESFPDDERVGNFDPADRKFIAVAAAHPKRPPILQATDSKWLDTAPFLKDHQIETKFLCPKDIRGISSDMHGPKRGFDSLHPLVVDTEELTQIVSATKNECPAMSIGV
jgi:hypothetical protein